MSETTVQYTTKQTPQVTALRSLQDVLTTEQIQRFADECKRMKETGEWGEVVIVFVNGDPKKVSVKMSWNF